jgi:Na+/proline symporter
MGRQPRSGDIPWLSAHSILNWIGGDIYMLILSAGMSSISCRFLHGQILPQKVAHTDFGRS